MNKFDNNNYRISDPAEVENIVFRFMEINLYEMMKYQKADTPTATYLTESIIDIEHLNPELVTYMDFMDIFCLIDHISENPDYEYTRNDGSICTSEMMQMLHYRLLKTYLRNAYNCSIPIKLFLSLTVKSFYTFLASVSLANVSSTKEIDDEYNFVKEGLQSVMKDCFDEETTTIKQVLDTVANVLRKPWCPISMQITDYQFMIIEAYTLLGRLLIGSFKIAFKNWFDIKSLKEKYSMDNPYIDPLY